MDTVSISLLPAHCSRCARAFLTPFGAGTDVHCRNCGGLARVVPGEVYRTKDAPLFAQIEASFHAVALPLTEASRMATELDNVLERTRSPYSVLLRVLRVVPGLHFLEPTHPGEEERLVRAMGMLLAIATARVRQGLDAPPSRAAT